MKLILIRQAIVKGENHLGPQLLNAPLQCPQLAVRVLTWVALLQCQEQGLGRAFRFPCQ
jgi:hypothetical protein